MPATVFPVGPKLARTIRSSLKNGPNGGNAVTANMPATNIPADTGVSAAMQKGQTILSDVSAGLTALGIIVVTIAVMFVGYRMLFGGAHWKDLAPIFWGGLLIGGAATVAGALLG